MLVPLALPSVFNSLRLLFGLAFGYVMLAEVVKLGEEAGGLGDIILQSPRRGPREHIVLILVTIPILAFILMEVVQTVMGNVVDPRLMAFSLNLSPLLVLVSLIFWGWLWGIVGMILAVPLTATIKIIFENIEPLRPIAVLMGGPITPKEKKPATVKVAQAVAE